MKEREFKIGTKEQKLSTGKQISDRRK